MEPKCTVMLGQEFLHVLSVDEARQLFFQVVQPAPLGQEEVALEALLGRVLAEPIVAPIDLPPFDRAIVDGFALRAEDTYGASEFSPRKVSLIAGPIEAGQITTREVGPGQALPIATGAMLPRGADAVVMVEDCEVKGETLVISRAVTPGSGVSFAGTDVSRGETVLWRGEVIGPADVAILAALGLCRAVVYRRPRVAIISTGNELIPAGAPLTLGKIYDANGPMLAAAVADLGCQVVRQQICPDDFDQLCHAISGVLPECDVLLLSGGTSKGGGDLSYQAVREVCRPGILVHGIASKPGKPLCLAVDEGKPVIILPGFPLSAIFTFHQFVVPLLCCLTGRRTSELPQGSARVAVTWYSESGRQEYVPVRVFPSQDVPSAWPIAKGSGSVSAFKQADGYLLVETLEEIVPAGSQRPVYWLTPESSPPDLTIIGSHCVGVDFLVGKLHDRGYRVKMLAAGSSAGLAAASREECDLAGIHLLDERSGIYNLPFLTETLELIRGYRRMQGIVFRPDDERFQGCGVNEVLHRIKTDPSCRMVNRNAGSGTRILIDRLLGGSRPPGYAVAVSTHHAVVAAIAQGRADWGIAVEWLARQSGLAFLPVAEEQFDFVVPKSRRNRPAVRAFEGLLTDVEVRAQLGRLGFRFDE